MRWDELQSYIMEFDQKGQVPAEDIADLTVAEKRRNISTHMFQVMHHFEKRIRTVYTFMKTENSLGEGYKMDDYFYRDEFQLRGYPHIHSLLYILDEDGKPAPHFHGDEESAARCVDFVDSVICGKKDSVDDPEVQQLAATYQTHSHTFTCYKKNKTFTIGSKEGHGKLDGKKSGPALRVPACRFNFPRPPMRKTMIIVPPTPDDDSEQVKQWQRYKNKFRAYVNRQTFQQYPGQVTEARARFLSLTYEEFLEDLGLTEEQYLKGLRVLVKTKGAQVFLRRDPADSFTNNYNAKLLKLHQANMDCSFVTDEYGTYTIFKRV